MFIRIDAKSKTGKVILRAEIDDPKLKTELFEQFKQHNLVEEIIIYTDEIETEKWTR